MSESIEMDEITNKDHRSNGINPKRKCARSQRNRHTKKKVNTWECSVTCCCDCRPRMKYLWWTLSIPILLFICAIIAVSLYALIIIGIAFFEIFPTHTSTTNSPMNLSTTSITDVTSFPSTFFIDNTTNDFTSDSTDSITSEDSTVTQTTTITLITTSTVTTTTRANLTITTPTITMTTTIGSTATSITTIMTSVPTTTITTTVPTTTTTDITTTMTTVPTTTTDATTITTTSTTRPTRTTAIPEPCPPILPKLIQTNNLLLLNATTSPLNYTRYMFSFDTPVDVTTALLVFGFQTKSGSWYLDDVSVKRNDGTGSELIQNGGFENGISNILWRYCYPPLSTFDAIISMNFCHSGRYCFASRFLLNNKDYLTQNFTVESNVKYNIEFYTFCSREPSLFNATISFQ